MCSELWGPSRPYKPSQWAHLAEVGWLGCEDGRIWREIGGLEAKEVKEEREWASTTSTRNSPPLVAQAPPPPRKKGNSGKATTGTTGKKSMRLESDSDAKSQHAASSSSSSSGEDSPDPKRQGPSPSRKRMGGEEGGESWERSGRGGEKKELGGGGYPLVGTTAHVPYKGGVEVGTVTGVLTSKSGDVWVRYPTTPSFMRWSNTSSSARPKPQRRTSQRCAKARPHHEPPPPPQRSPLTPPLTPKKTLNPTKIPPLTHLTPQPPPKVPRRYGTRKRAPERFHT